MIEEGRGFKCERTGFAVFAVRAKTLDFMDNDLRKGLKDNIARASAIMARVDKESRIMAPKKDDAVAYYKHFGKINTKNIMLATGKISTNIFELRVSLIVSNAGRILSFPAYEPNRFVSFTRSRPKTPFPFRPASATECLGHGGAGENK